jgi:probable non-F420 flavinoid oxidoreductase
MTRFGYHVSHEQYPPSELLRLVRAANDAGFDGALSSDHFHPWLEENGQSGFGWSWLGAALSVTEMDFGTVNAPGDRYHPAIIAQAAATVAEMFPERFWIAIGTGEASNEHITGAQWPTKSVRQQRLRECADVMRSLWRGETVTHRGLVTVDEARLYSLPTKAPLLLGAAVSDETATWLGGWADGLITTGRPKQEMSSIMAAFRKGGGEGKPVYVQHVLAWHPDEAHARREAHQQWRFSTLDAEQLWNLRTPEEFARATARVSIDDVAKKFPISSDLDHHGRVLADYAELGVDRVFCFNVCRNQDAYIDTFGKHVLAALR